MNDAASAIEEWNAAEQFLFSQCIAICDSIELPEEFRNYVLSSKGFSKYIYPLSAWVCKPEIRFSTGCAFALHCYGIKLLDDIIDQDQPFTDADLVSAGTAFCNQALSDLGKVGALSIAMELYPVYWPQIWRHTRKEPTTVINTLDHWAQSARIKCGRILAYYGEIACVMSGLTQEAAHVKSGLEAMGIVYTVLDDIRDAHNPREQHSNIKVLIDRGAVDRGAAAAMVDAAAAEFESCIEAAPPAFPVFYGFRKDIEKVRRALADPELTLTA